MDLNTKKQEIEKQIQQNKIDQIKHQELLQRLARGADYLQGSLDTLNKLLEESSANENKDTIASS